MSWGTNAKKTTKEVPVKTGFGKEYYRNLFENNTAQSGPVRMALVAKENCAKSGLAISIARQVRPKGKVIVIDVDNSAQATIEEVYGDDKDITVLPLLDERDESIYNEDSTINYAALIDKANFYVNIIADKVSEGEDIAAIVFDGG